MLIVISPAKTLDFKSPVKTRQHTQPELLKEEDKYILDYIKTTKEFLPFKKHSD